MLQALWLLRGQASTSVTSHYLPDKCTATVIYIGGNPGSAALCANLRGVNDQEEKSWDNGSTLLPLRSSFRASSRFDLGLPALRDDALADKGLPFTHHTDCL